MSIPGQEGEGPRVRVGGVDPVAMACAGSYPLFARHPLLLLGHIRLQNWRQMYEETHWQSGSLPVGQYNILNSFLQTVAFLPHNRIQPTAFGQVTRLGLWPHPISLTFLLSL